MLAIDISTAISAAASAAMAAARVHLLSASAIKPLRSSQGISFINAFSDLITTPKPLRSRESTSSINSPPPMTLVFSVGILSFVFSKNLRRPWQIIFEAQTIHFQYQ
ncbi:hypothetical protein HN51_007904 [Arachis hypogaea]